MKFRSFKILMAGAGLALVWTGNPAMADEAALMKRMDALEKELANVKKELADEKAKNEESEKKDPGFSVKWEPAPKISSEDGRFEMNLRGRLMADAVWHSDDVSSMDTKTTELRRTRLGIEGKAWNNVKYKFEIDFAGNEVEITDAFISIKGGGIEWAFGQQKQPVSLDEQTSSRYISVMEHAAFTDAFNFARQLGVTGKVGGENWTFTLGAFRGDANGATDMDLGSAFAGRVTFAPNIGNDDTDIHLGGSFMWRKQGDDQGDVRYRQRPFVHATSKRFVSTNSDFREDFFFGVEAAVVHGRFSAQGEWGWLRAEFEPSFNASERAKFSGGYGEVSFFLTDDSRNYEADDGAFGRVKPSKSLFKGGTGAVQIVYRFDVVDLGDTVSMNGGGSFLYPGGRQVTHIIGINWYWNNYVRWMLNYAHNKVTDSLLGAASLNDAMGNNTINAFGIRTQVDW